MDIKSIAISVIAGVVGGVGASGVVADWRQLSIDEHFQKSPPVVVVDFAKISMQYPEAASSEEVEKLMTKTNNAVVRLRDAGYMVLDASAVVAAPDDVYFPEDLMQ